MNLCVLFVFICCFHELQVQASPPQPELIINKPAIYETDSVTLNCLTPSSESQCYYTFGETVRILSCLQTLTGSELLLMSHQSSPAVIKVACFYTEKLGDIKVPSLHSDPSFITINTAGKPELTLHHSPGDSVIFICTLPGSAHHGSTCNLYLGEAGPPVATATVNSKTNSKKQSFCQFYLTVDDLLRWLCSVQQKDASCDYTLGSEPDSLSPPSDGYSLKDFVAKETRMTSNLPACAVTTAPDASHLTFVADLNVDEPVTSTPVTTRKHTSAPAFGTTSNIVSTRRTSVTPTSGLLTDSPTVADDPVSTLTPAQTTPETGKWVVTSFGVPVVVILLGLTLLCTKRGKEGFYTRTQAKGNDILRYMSDTDYGRMPLTGKDETYSVIMYVPAADFPDD